MDQGTGTERGKKKKKSVNGKRRTKAEAEEKRERAGLGAGELGARGETRKLAMAGIAGKLTDRDLEILRFVGRTKIVRAEHIGQRFGTQRSKSYQRLQVLKAAGLVATETAVPGPAVYYATRAGLKLAALPLLEARVALGALVHDLALSEALSYLERDGAGLEILTEREMRAELRLRGETNYRFRVTGNWKLPDHTHWPDLVAVGPDGRWAAIEVELTEKAAQRTKRILRGYGGHRHETAAVIYVVPDASRAERLVRFERDEVYMERVSGTQFRAITSLELLAFTVEEALDTQDEWMRRDVQEREDREARRLCQAEEERLERERGDQELRDQQEQKEAERREAERPINRLKRAFVEPPRRP